MITLIVAGLIAVAAVVFVKLTVLRQTTDELAARLGEAEDEILRLKRRVESGSATQVSPVKPSVEAVVGETLAPAKAADGGPAPIPPPIQAVPPPLPTEAPAPLLSETIAEAPAVAPARLSLPAINWEHFMGVKLFAWLSGFALFVGVSFFVKYAFDNNLVPPELRVTLGFLVGVGLLVAGVFLRNKDYAVTAQTFCATGVLILYATTFACRNVYHFEFFDLSRSFALMALITAAAFLLAVRTSAQVVAVLGLAGGFLTPVLMRSGADNAVGLFGYVALLDLGLAAVALRRPWTYLLTLGALGTVGTQLGWAVAWFAPEKVHTAMAAFLGLDVLFLAVAVLVRWRQRMDKWVVSASVLVSGFSLLFVFSLLAHSELGAQPWNLFAFALGADLCLLALALLERELEALQLAAAIAVFLLLAAWTAGFMSASLMNWGLGAALAFALLHAALPLAAQRLRPGGGRLWWAHLFPPLALLLILAPLVRFNELSLFLWPCVLLIDLVAVFLALLTASVLALAAVLLLTTGIIAVWVISAPMVAGDLPEILLIVGGFSVCFFLAGLFSGRRLFGPLGQALRLYPEPDAEANGLGLGLSPRQARAQIPAMSAVLPFLLLIMMTVRLAPADPTPVFGMGLAMVLLLLGVARWARLDALPGVALGCALALLHVWHFRCFANSTAALALAWYLAFHGVLTVFPFLFRRRFEGTTAVWAAAALAGPAHFHLVYDLFRRAWPNDFMGLLPAGFALPALAALVFLGCALAPEHPRRTSILAWFGGVALFFITLIFPIQFEKQWITIGWALEGAALLWLFGRLPHPGLRLAGGALLVAAFVRLAMNPAVLTYQPRAAAPILNWYLYAYGIVTACLFAGAWLARPPQERVAGVNLRALLASLGVVLGFLLLNIEIADYFMAEGSRRLVFEFGGNFGRDMAYSLGWALYALTLLGAGIGARVPLLRYAGMGLLGVTLLKLFFHDLFQLGKLYRVGAFIGVAVVAIAASLLYQKFFAGVKAPAAKE